MANIFPFMKLPLELREQIYTLSVNDGKPVRINYTRYQYRYWPTDSYYELERRSGQADVATTAGYELSVDDPERNELVPDDKELVQFRVPVISQLCKELRVESLKRIFKTTRFVHYLDFSCVQAAEKTNKELVCFIKRIIATPVCEPQLIQAIPSITVYMSNVPESCSAWSPQWYHTGKTFARIEKYGVSSSIIHIEMDPLDPRPDTWHFSATDEELVEHANEVAKIGAQLGSLGIVRGRRFIERWNYWEHTPGWWWRRCKWLGLPLPISRGELGPDNDRRLREGYEAEDGQVPDDVDLVSIDGDQENYESDDEPFDEEFE